MNAIEIDSLVKKFGSVTAVDGLCLSIAQREIYGFLGPNGAGKTTTIRILSTLTRATAGRVAVNGEDVSRDPVGAKRQIGVVHQSFNVDPELTGTENLTVYGLLFGIPVHETRKRIKELLEFVDLSECIDRRVSTYSGGLKRRLTIARALIHKPKVIILDEPTAGLDAVARRKVWSLIRNMREVGSTILVTTHYIEEAQQLSDRVGILDRGKLIAEDTPARLISRVGKVAVERDDSDGLDISFFETRDEAAQHIARHPVNARIRDTNLEDVFISLTGRREILSEQAGTHAGFGHGHGHGGNG